MAKTKDFKQIVAKTKDFKQIVAKTKDFVLKIGFALQKSQCVGVECTWYGTANSWSLGSFKWFSSPKNAHTIVPYFVICCSILWNLLFHIIEFAVPYYGRANSWSLDQGWVGGLLLISHCSNPLRVSDAFTLSKCSKPYITLHCPNVLCYMVPALHGSMLHNI